MTAPALVDVLDRVAGLCRDTEPPAWPADRDAVLTAALRLGSSVIGLAERIIEAQHEWDATQANRRPYPPPSPKPPQPPPKPPPPPPPPKGGPT